MNPNASEFQYNPSGMAANPRDSFTEYTNMIESIENEMDNEAASDLAEAMNDVSVKPVAAQPATGLPSHLAKHAAEFWFPECRDCSCCKGFKHGCQCAPTNGGICTCSGTGDASTSPVAATPASAAGGNRIACKFYLSPGGCRFGNKCKFAHA